MGEYINVNMDTYTVIKKYEPLIKKTIRIYIKDKNYYEDAYQEACIAIIQVMSRFKKEKGDFNAYIKCAVIYAIKAFANKIKENVSLDEELEDGGSLYDLIADDADIEGEYLESVDKKMLYNALNKLSQKQKEVIEDYYFNGKSLVEIAKERRCHYNSVVRLKERALEKLRQEFN